MACKALLEIKYIQMLKYLSENTVQRHFFRHALYAGLSTPSLFCFCFVLLSLNLNQNGHLAPNSANYYSFPLHCPQVPLVVIHLPAGSLKNANRLGISQKFLGPSRNNQEIPKNRVPKSDIWSAFPNEAWTTNLSAKYPYFLLFDSCYFELSYVFT